MVTAKGKIYTNYGFELRPDWRTDSEITWQWGANAAESPHYVYFQLPYSMCGDPSFTPDAGSTQGRFRAPRAGYITGVTVKFYGDLEMRQGLGTGGYPNLYDQFFGLYLGDGTQNDDIAGSPLDKWNDVKAWFKPPCVKRYLYSKQYQTGQPNRVMSLPTEHRIELPPEDWVFVNYNEPLPYISMVCPLTRGSPAADAGYLKINNNSTDAGQIVTGAVLFRMNNPHPLPTTGSRGDTRWNTGTQVLTPATDPYCSPP